LQEVERVWQYYELKPDCTVFISTLETLVLILPLILKLDG